MPISIFPTAAGGGIKLVQRGLAASAGTVTITAVTTSKAYVNVFGTTSSGAAAVSGTVGAMSGGSNAGAAGNNTDGSSRSTSSFSGNTANITGGTTNLVTAVVQGYLSSATELVVSGACRWEVIEFA
jgi:hypothetical protein